MHLNRKRHYIFIVLLSVIMAMAAFLCVSAAEVSTATAKIDGKNVNIRKSTSTSSKIITTVKDNTKLTVNKIVFTSTTSRKASKIWYYVKVSGKTGYVRSDFVDSLSYKTVKGTTTDELNYRKGAGGSMALAGTLKKGKTVSIVLNAKASDSASWYKIKKDSKYYYVSSKFVKLTETKKEEASGSDTDKKEETKEEKSKEETKEEAKEEKTDDVSFKKSDVTYPTTLEVGSSFGLKGTVTCNKTITKVKFGILDSDGSFVLSASKDVGSKTFSISKVDSQITFGRIAPGSYKYVGYFYVNGKWYKSVIKYSFTVKAVEKTLTDEKVNARIQEMIDALSGKYFTTDKKPCYKSVADACNVVKVIKENSIVKNLIKENKGEGTVDTSLFPHHYNPSGATMTLGWSCCGFAGFAGWYVAADDINSNVEYAIAKLGIKYNYDNMKKYARVGDLCRTSTHSFMVISVEGDGCKVIDSNWGRNCIVSVHKIAWSQYDTVTISRATIRK